MSKSAYIRVRVEPELKIQAEAIFKEFGVTATQVITMLYKQVLRNHGGNYLIDKSEFNRVFPYAHTKRAVAHTDEQGSRTALEVEVKYLKEMLAEKAKQNEFLHKHYQAGPHLLDTGFNYNDRVAAICWGEGVHGGFVVWGYHYLKGYHDSVPVDSTYAEGCNIIDGW